MLDDHRMRRTYGAARVVRRLQSFAQEATRIVRPVVLDIQGPDPLDQCLGHPGESRFHAAEPSVAALGRNFQRIQH